MHAMLLCLLVGQTFEVRGNDDVAINAQVARAVAAGGGVVHVPRGRYDLNAPVSIQNCQNVTLRGDGPATVLGSGNYCGPLVAVGLPCATVPPEHRPPSPLNTSAPKASAATLGKLALAVTGHQFQFGHLSPQSQPDYWGGGGQVTIDFAVSKPADAVWQQWTNLFGLCSPPDAPAPWVVRWADGMFVLDLTTAGGGRRRLRCPVPAEAVWRVTFQVDCSADRAAAWADGKQVSAAWDPAWTVNPGPFSLATHDGVTPFSVGYPAPRMDGLGGNGIANLVLHGLRVCRSAVYQWAAAQAFASPLAALNDDNRYFTGSGQVIPDGSLVGLLPMDPEANGSPWLSLLAPRGRGLAAWCPPLQAIGGGTSRVAVEDLRLAGALQPALLAGRFTGLALRRVVSDGASQAVGSLPLMVSYPLYLDECDLSGWDAPVVAFWQMVEARGLVLSAVGRHGIRCAGGEGLWDGVKVWRLAPYTESVFHFVGADDGLGQEVRRCLVDNEDYAPGVAFVDVHQGPVQRGDVSIDGLSVNTTGPTASMIRLVGHGTTGGYAPYRISARRLIAFGTAATGLRVDGAPSWHGDVDLSQLWPGKVAGDGAAVARIAVTPPTDLYKPASPAPATMPVPVPP